MKKILLGTTGLVGVALLATAANAETPKVTLGGFSDFQAGFISDDNDSARNGVDFRNDNTIIVKVDGKTSAGLGYGAQIDLEADITADNNNQGTNASRTFTYLDGNWGRVEMGGNRSVAATQRIDASTIAVATGGINGSWGQFLTAGAGSTVGAGGSATSLGAGAAGRFQTSSKLAGEHGAFNYVGDESTYNATKVSYYTPKYFGFQAGVSYTPSLQARGQVGNAVDTSGQSDVINAALGYEGTFSGFKVAAAGTYETANGNGAGVGNQDIEGWNVGGSVGYKGFTVAGSYGDLSDTGQGAGDESDYWTAGLAYENGPIGVSATYLDSTYNPAGTAVDNDFKNLVLGADYKLAPGLTPYAEVSFYEFDGQNTAATNNNGTMVILGTQVAF